MNYSSNSVAAQKKAKMRRFRDKKWIGPKKKAQKKSLHRKASAKLVRGKSSAQKDVLREVGPKPPEANKATPPEFVQKFASFLRI